MPIIVGKDTSVLHRVTCRNCSSVLEYAECERQHRSHTDYSGGTDTWKVIICPCCGKDVHVN